MYISKLKRIHIHKAFMPSDRHGHVALLKLLSKLIKCSGCQEVFEIGEALFEKRDSNFTILTVWHFAPSLYPCVHEKYYCPTFSILYPTNAATCDVYFLQHKPQIFLYTRKMRPLRLIVGLAPSACAYVYLLGNRRPAPDHSLKRSGFDAFSHLNFQWHLILLIQKDTTQVLSFRNEHALFAAISTSLDGAHACAGSNSCKYK